MKKDKRLKNMSSLKVCHRVEAPKNFGEDSTNLDTQMFLIN